MGSLWNTVGYRGKSMGYRGIPWGSLWDTVKPHTPWDTVLSLWHTVGYRGIPWDTVKPYTPWNTMANLWDTVESRGKSVGYRGK